MADEAYCNEMNIYFNRVCLAIYFNIVYVSNILTDSLFSRLFLPKYLTHQSNFR